MLVAMHLVKFKGGLTPPTLNAHAEMDPLVSIYVLFVSTLRYWT